MAVPLPEPKSFGEMIMDRMRQGSQNALLNEQLRSQAMENQFAPEKNKLAMEQSKSAEERKNQLFPEELKKAQMANIFNQQMNPLELQQAQMKSKFSEPEMQARLAYQQAQTNRMNKLLPYDIKEAELRPDVMRSQIENQRALAQNRESGISGMGVGGRALFDFKKQLAFEHPDWNPQQVDQAASGYLSGSNKDISGNTLPTLSGMSQSSLAQAQRYNAPVGVQNQAANMSIVANEINDIPIESIAKFAGPLGKFNYATEMGKMVTNPESVSEDFRKYKEYQDVISIFAMDTLRKGFGTSVVPEYVYDTLGKALNPQTSWWNDPKQVSRDLQKVKDWVNKNSESLKKQIRGGVTADLSEEKSSKNNDPLGIR